MLLYGHIQQAICLAAPSGHLLEKHPSLTRLAIHQFEYPTNNLHPRLAILGCVHRVAESLKTAGHELSSGFVIVNDYDIFFKV